MKFFSGKPGNLEAICSIDHEKNRMIYVSMFSAEYPFVVDKTLYDEIENTYGG